MKTYFWFSPKINEKSYCISLFSNRTLQKIFFVPPPYKHTTVVPGQPLIV